jgi:hypothetical protein
MTKNPIEDVVPFLHEVGSALVVAAMCVEGKLLALKEAEAKVANIRQELERERKGLLAMVRNNYVDSEIEAADVLCTRHEHIGASREV